VRFVCSYLRAGERRRGRERREQEGDREEHMERFVTVRWSWAGVVLLALLVQKYLLASTKVLAYCLGPVDSCLFCLYFCISNCRPPRQLLQGINLRTTMCLLPWSFPYTCQHALRGLLLVTSLLFWSRRCGVAT